MLIWYYNDVLMSIGQSNHENRLVLIYYDSHTQRRVVVTGEYHQTSKIQDWQKYEWCEHFVC